jgi:hypothetical protein
MHKDKDGSLVFKRGKYSYRFESTNYNNHCLKHPKLNIDKHLKEIEDAISDPDKITRGPKTNQKAYYKVINYKNQRDGILVSVWKVVVFLNKGGGEIATAFDFSAYNYQVIHSLEKTIWTKQNSLI